MKWMKQYHPLKNGLKKKIHTGVNTINPTRLRGILHTFGCLQKFGCLYLFNNGKQMWSEQTVPHRTNCHADLYQARPYHCANTYLHLLHLRLHLIPTSKWETLQHTVCPLQNQGHPLPAINLQSGDQVPTYQFIHGSLQKNDSCLSYLQNGCPLSDPSPLYNIVLQQLKSTMRP